MGAPAIAVGVLTRTKTARWVAGLVLLAVAAVGLVIVAPLLVVPMALAASAAPPPAPDASEDGFPAANGDWGYPLAGAYTKGRGFGYNPVKGCGYCSTHHLGYDMAQGCGTTIYAAGPGTVITAGAYYGWGNSVRIDHGGGLVTLYGHMQWDSLRVTSGQAVTAGTPLGAEGNTGASFGCHLHFEVRQNNTPVPPEPFMAERGLPLS
ncbi:MAG: hypothetical protein K0Q52_66 [Microbacterium sp.]|jgi:murein DD-endopeptidase MepM/ murein hydrolase activator NlpD|nr:hypothetical protein [Microbacterium sp.]